MMYHSNKTTSKNINLGGKRVSGAFMSNSSVTKKKPQTYKRLSNQRDQGLRKSKIVEKENWQKANNKNSLRLSRNSVGGPTQLHNNYYTSNNLSSTGAYNSITKNPREENRPSTVTKMAKRNDKYKSSKGKPLYQMCETGASVEKFSKESGCNRDESFSIQDLSLLASENQEEFNDNIVVVNRQTHDLLQTQPVKPKAFMYEQETRHEVSETVNNCDSDQSSISDSAVSEGSLVVQNLPVSKITNATKKYVPPVTSYKPMKSQRTDYVIKSENLESKTLDKNIPFHSKYEYSMKEEVYEVESSSDSSDGFDDSMEVKFELEGNAEEWKLTHLNEQYISNFNHKQYKPETVKNKLAHTQKLDNFGAKSNSVFKFDKNQRKSHGNRLDVLKQKAREQKTINYSLRLAVEKGDLATLKKILKKTNSLKYPCINVNSQNPDQWTLLHIATNEGNYSIVKLLLENGADPNPQSVNQRTALHLACMRGHPSIVKILLDYKADINVADMDGNTPVHLCSEFGKYDIN